MSYGINRIKENSKNDLKTICETLIKIIQNVLDNPNDSKYRRVFLESDDVVNNLMPYSGGLETLFEIGFQEEDDSFFLPLNENNEKLKSIKNELMKLLNTEKKICENINEKEFQKAPEGRICPTSRISNRNEFGLKNPNNNRFALKLQSSYNHVLIYEDPDLKNKALRAIPVDRLKSDAKMKFESYMQNNQDQKPYDLNDFILIELLAWFKNDFFEWVNQPDCNLCRTNENMTYVKNDGPNHTEIVWNAGNVEVYRCSICNQLTRFPRYNHPSKLLETRGGRCGEWANCFCLCLRALNFDARYVLDWTDHVWCEAYSNSQKRWLHADPCENALDKPLLYENGWNKKLSYVIAFSKDECVDVSWRYSSKHKEVLSRRNECDEQWLVYYANELSKKRQSQISQSEREKLQMRMVTEIVEFLTPKQAKEGEDIGRQSGSLQWRLTRGEIQASGIKNMNKITIDPKNIPQNKFNLKYNTVRNCYVSTNGINHIETKGWEQLAYGYSNIKYKTEQDWKMCYLAREKGPNSGYIEWYFDIDELAKSKKGLDKIELKFNSKCFESGEIELNLYAIHNSDTESEIFNDLTKSNSSSEQIHAIRLEDISSLKAFKLKANLSKGNGDNAWQHTQLFRQSLNDTENYLFDINFYFN